MASSTAFDAVNSVSTRFHTQRINRRLDDRDSVIKEAVSILEEKSRSYFPLAHKVQIVHNAANVITHTQAANDVVITVTGANFSTADTGASMCSARLGDVVLTLNTSTNSATNAVFTLANADYAFAAGDIICFRMHSEEVLVCELYLTVA